ncbi:MAG TPA: hypothetical protein VD994_21780, partial [Prosthecobacter sp.]|nr:hypothetical protein [Prosthecobacter sp.]
MAEFKIRDPVPLPMPPGPKATSPPPAPKFTDRGAVLAAKPPLRFVFQDTCPGAVPMLRKNPPDVSKTALFVLEPLNRKLLLED